MKFFKPTTKEQNVKLLAKKSYLDRAKDNAKKLWQFFKPPAKKAASRAVVVAKSIHIEPHPRRRALINFAKGLPVGVIVGTILRRRLRASRVRPSV